jgi:hypothetical protein
VKYTTHRFSLKKKIKLQPWGPGVSYASAC